jgi:hypothetical protein
MTTLPTQLSPRVAWWRRHEMVVDIERLLERSDIELLRKEQPR